MPEDDQLPRWMDPRSSANDSGGRVRRRRSPLPAGLDPRRGFVGGRLSGPAAGGSRIGLAGKVLAGLLSVVVLAVTGAAWAMYRQATGNISHLDAIPTAGNRASKSASAGSAQNILLIGDDSRNGLTQAQLAQLATQNDGGGVNTDTMMLVHIPADGSQATAVSLPRDLWVDVPGHGHYKLNAAFNIGAQARDDPASRTAGFRLLIQTVSELTGLHIDHFVEVNLWGFYSISKAVGGIRVDMCEPVHDRYSGIDLPAGVSTIEGTQALAFVRQRHGLVNGDLDRVRRQQYFIGAVFKKVESAGVLLNPIRLDHLLSAVTKVLTTDPGLDPIKLVDQMRGLTAGNLRFTTIPITGLPRIDGQDVITYDPVAVKALFANLSAPTKPTTRHAPATPRSTVAPSQVTVVVRNAAGTAGIATRTTTELAARGFHATVGNNLPVQSATEIHYTPNDAVQARTLAAAIPGATLVSDLDAGGGLQLDLGSGFTGLGARSTTPKPRPTPAATPSTRTAADRGCIY